MSRHHEKMKKIARGMIEDHATDIEFLTVLETNEDLSEEDAWYVHNLIGVANVEVSFNDD